MKGIAENERPLDRLDSVENSSRILESKFGHDPSISFDSCVPRSRRYDLVTYREDRKLFMDEYTKSESKVASIRNLTLFYASHFCRLY